METKRASKHQKKGAAVRKIKNLFVNTGKLLKKKVWLPICRFFRKIGLFFVAIWYLITKKSDDNEQKRGTVHSESLEKSNSGVAVNPARVEAASKIVQQNEESDEEESEETPDGKFAITWTNDRKPWFVSSIFVTVFRVFCLVFVLLAFVGIGTAMGIVRAFIASAPELSEEKISDSSRTSYIYDINNELVMEYFSSENRDWASYDEIPTMLKYAVVASEDETFFEHSGFNIKRFVAAALSDLSGGSVFGGSTITQQVLKLTLLTSEQTYKRKIQEIYLAYQLEKQYSKEDILEWYMNIMPMGGLTYGVKAAAKDYFGKELDELNLRECAVLAGITQSPTYYHPRLNFLSVEEGGRGTPERVYTRANYVLTQMFTCGFITQEEYEEALFDVDDKETVQLEVVKTATSTDYDHKYYVEYVMDDVVEILMEQNGWTGTMGKNQALSMLRTGGLHIQTALDVNVQSAVENAVYSFNRWPTFSNSSHNYSSNGVIQPQCAVVVIDNTTGYLAAIVGGRSEPTVKQGLNRASDSRLPLGSSIKPLAIYAPYVDMGLQQGMAIENIAYPIENWNSATGYPQNLGDSEYFGPSTVAYSLIKSLNVPTARILMQRVGINYSLSYMRNLGFTLDLSAYSQPSSLALGSTGNYLIESVAAFATFPNSGVYREPLSVTHIYTPDGETIFDPSMQVRRTVFKSSTCWLITHWLNRAISAPESAVDIKLANAEIQVAGKTGTNENAQGIGFIGYTKYYTCGVWIGHDDYGVPFSSNITALYYATPLWRAVMNPLHENHPAAEIFGESDEVVPVTICTVSGLLPNGDLCEHNMGMTGADATHSAGVVTEYFVKGTEPTEVCNMHVALEICTETGKVATDECRAHGTVTTIAAVNLASDSPYLDLLKGNEARNITQLYSYFPYFYANGTIYTKYGTGADAYCNHSGGESTEQIEITAARTLIEEVEADMNGTYADYLSEEQRQTLTGLINSLQAEINAQNIKNVVSMTESLQTTAEEIFQALDEMVTPSPGA